MEFPAGVFTPQTFIFKIILLRINDFHAQCDLTVFLQTPKTFFLKTMFTVLCFLCMFMYLKLKQYYCDVRLTRTLYYITFEIYRIKGHAVVQTNHHIKVHQR
jgi:hypothetical protein